MVALQVSVHLQHVMVNQSDLLTSTSAGYSARHEWTLCDADPPRGALMIRVDSGIGKYDYIR